MLRNGHLALAVDVAEVPVNVDVSGSSAVGESAESSVRQIDAVRGRAAGASILNSDGDGVALATNTISAGTGVGNENLAATVRGGI